MSQVLTLQKCKSQKFLRNFRIALLVSELKSWYKVKPSNLNKESHPKPAKTEYSLCDVRERTKTRYEMRYSIIQLCCPPALSKQSFPRNSL